MKWSLKLCFLMGSKLMDAASGVEINDELVVFRLVPNNGLGQLLDWFDRAWWHMHMSDVIKAATHPAQMQASAIPSVVATGTGTGTGTRTVTRPASSNGLPGGGLAAIGNGASPLSLNCIVECMCTYRPGDGYVACHLRKPRPDKRDPNSYSVILGTLISCDSGMTFGDVRSLFPESTGAAGRGAGTRTGTGPGATSHASKNSGRKFAIPDALE